MNLNHISTLSVFKQLIPVISLLADTDMSIKQGDFSFVSGLVLDALLSKIN